MDPLHLASDHKHQECIKLLLDAGADPNIKNNYEESAFDLTDEATKIFIKRYIEESSFDLKEPDHN